MKTLFNTNYWFLILRHVSGMAKTVSRKREKSSSKEIPLPNFSWLSYPINDAPKRRERGTKRGRRVPNTKQKSDKCLKLQCNWTFIHIVHFFTLFLTSYFMFFKFYLGFFSWWTRASLLWEMTKKVPVQLMVCRVGDLWRTWRIPNWF